MNTREQNKQKFPYNYETTHERRARLASLGKVLRSNNPPPGVRTSEESEILGAMGVFGYHHVPGKLGRYSMGRAPTESVAAYRERLGKVPKKPKTEEKKGILASIKSFFGIGTKEAA